MDINFLYVDIRSNYDNKLDDGECSKLTIFQSNKICCIKGVCQFFFLLLCLFRANKDSVPNLYIDDLHLIT